MRRVQRASMHGLRRGNLPPLRPGGDAQRIRVLALTAPPRERRAWRKQLVRGIASRRASAAVAIGAVHGAASALILGRALLQDPSPFVRRISAEALGLAGGRAAAGALTRALGERVPSVRAAIFRALGRCGVESEDVFDALIQGLGHVDARVCEAALLALWDARHPEVGELAAAMCVHPSGEVRRAALVIAHHELGNHSAVLRGVDDEDPAAAQLARELTRTARAG